MVKRNIKGRDELQPGDMIIYPFLWGWEREKGIVKATKMRPSMVIYRIDDEVDDPVVAIVPITTQPKIDPTTRISIPKREMLRVGMDVSRSQSICLHDCNMERIKTSETLSQTVPIRTFSETLVSLAQAKFKSAFVNKLVYVVDRKSRPEPVWEESEVQNCEVAAGP